MGEVWQLTQLNCGGEPWPVGCPYHRIATTIEKALGILLSKRPPAAQPSCRNRYPKIVKDMETHMHAHIPTNALSLSRTRTPRQELLWGRSGCGPIPYSHPEIKQTR
jgi:hypothetical protein